MLTLRFPVASQVKTLSVTNASAIAAIGYCSGGTGIIELLRAYPNGTEGLRGERLTQGLAYMLVTPVWFVLLTCTTVPSGW